MTDSSYSFYASDAALEPVRQDTATRILDVAERLFVEHGFEATSLRMITQQAEVNLAAVNYHFGSKDALLQQAVIRRLAPWSQACVTELDALEALEEALSVERLVMAFILPSLAMSRDPSRGGAIFVRLLSRTFIENHKLLREAISVQHSEFVSRYSRAFAKVLPHLSADELAWRLHFSFSLMFNAFAGNDVLKIFLKRQGTVTAREPELVAKHLVPYVVAGLLAPPSDITFTPQSPS